MYSFTTKGLVRGTITDIENIIKGRPLGKLNNQERVRVINDVEAIFTLIDRQPERAPHATSPQEIIEGITTVLQVADGEQRELKEQEEETILDLANCLLFLVAQATGQKKE